MLRLSTLVLVSVLVGQSVCLAQIQPRPVMQAVVPQGQLQGPQNLPSTMTPNPAIMGQDPVYDPNRIEVLSPPSNAGYQMLPYFQADGIFLHRTQNNSDVGRIDYGMGPRFVLGRPFGDRSALEVVYFSLQDMNGYAFVADPITANSGGLAGTGINNQLSYRAAMHNVEANYRFFLTQELSVIGGFRYLNWHENLGSSFDPVNPFAGVTLPAGSIRQNYHTTNDMFGFQIGADWKSMISQRLGIDAGFKAGVFGTSSDFDANLSIPGLGTVATAGSRSRTSFVGEIGIVGTYQVTDYLKFRAGYQLMWIEGLALAPNQVDTANFLGTSSVHNRGGVFLHGFITGLELRW